MDSLVKMAAHGLKETNTAAQNDTAIAASLEAISGLGGGYLIVPPGIFWISSNINLPNQTGIIGSGAFTSQFKAASPITGGMIQMIGTKSVYRQGHRVEGLCLWGNSLASAGIVESFCCYSNIIRNVQIKECVDQGILFTSDFINGCWGNTIEHFFIDKCGRGLEMHTSANAVRVLNGTIAECAGAGIWSETSTAVNIFGCTLEVNGQSAAEPYGIMILGGMTSLIQGCYFEGNGCQNAGGAHIYAGKTIWNGVDGLTISGCYFQGLDTWTQNVLNIGDGEVTIFGGYSNRHAGKAIVTRTDGVVNRYGFKSVDVAGIV
jgi:hypothetical protein